MTSNSSSRMFRRTKSTMDDMQDEEKIDSTSSFSVHKTANAGLLLVNIMHHAYVNQLPKSMIASLNNWLTDLTRESEACLNELLSEEGISLESDRLSKSKAARMTRNILSKLRMILVKKDSPAPFSEAVDKFRDMFEAFNKRTSNPMQPQKSRAKVDDGLFSSQEDVRGSRRLSMKPKDKPEKGGESPPM